MNSEDVDRLGVLGEKINGLRKELAETKQVLSDLMLEKLPKIYVLSRLYGRDSRENRGAFVSLASAQAAANRREGGGGGLSWSEHNSHGQCWTAAVSGENYSSGYLIDELEWDLSL